MKFNLDILTKVFIGIGLGTLAVSCLTSTIYFGRYANSFSTLEKYYFKTSFDSKSSMFDSSIAIAVLGCISFIAAIAAIVLSILFENQTLLLIIIGGISSLFAFACIISEGILTQKCYQNYVITENNLIYKNHKGAQKYIKKAIKQLYEQAVVNFHNQNSRLEFPSWSYVENLLGTKTDDDDHIITYNDLWDKRSKSDYVPICFYRNSHRIVAVSNSSNTVNVAFIGYICNGNKQKWQRVCWYNSDQTNVKCKNMKTYKIYNEEFEFPDSIGDNRNFLNENIVVGQYYSEKQREEEGIDVDYEVNRFPKNFRLLYNGQFQDSEFVDDSSNHYKISGKKWVKANYKSVIEQKTRKDRFFLAPYKIKNYHDYVFNQAGYDGDSDYFSENEKQFSDIKTTLQYYSKDSKKGIVIPGIKNYYKQERKNSSKRVYYNNDLYQIALINMIIQIFGILFWAVGKFIPNGESNEKEQSENEQIEKEQNENEQSEKDQSTDLSENNQKVQEV